MTKEVDKSDISKVEIGATFAVIILHSLHHGSNCFQ